MLSFKVDVVDFKQTKIEFIVTTKRRGALSDHIPQLSKCNGRAAPILRPDWDWQLSWQAELMIDIDCLARGFYRCSNSTINNHHLSTWRQLA